LDERDEAMGGWRKLEMRSLIINDQVEDEMGKSCSMIGAEKECI
jgi:hypothetical protein